MEIIDLLRSALADAAATQQRPHRMQMGAPAQVAAAG
jgi:hypothetical protein